MFSITIKRTDGSREVLAHSEYSEAVAIYERKCAEFTKGLDYSVTLTRKSEGWNEILRYKRGNYTWSI